MSGDGIDLAAWVGLTVGLAVAIGMARLLLWQRSAPVGARAPRWRLALLIALQPTIGLLLYLVLFPPSVATRTGTLVVATAGAPATIALGVGEVLVALPEAGLIQGATGVPDLATALRRFPNSARVRIEGEGLVPRDQTSLPVPLDFDPSPRPRGLVDLALPGPVAPGAPVSIGGQVGTLAAGWVELVDPADVVVDRVPIAAGQRFVVTGDTRASGLAVFTVRLRDAAGALVEQSVVPVQTVTQPAPRVLILAGAPGAETKYLARWAQDARITLSLDIDIGAGAQLGGPSVPLTRSALAEFDLVVIDDRRWDALGAGARAAVGAAIGDGLGLLLRPTGPLAEDTRRSWAALGIPVTGGQDSLAFRLAPERPTPLSRTEADADAQTEARADVLPELARRDLGYQSPRAISILRDADGVPLASWWQRGRGRVGVWTVTDSYALVLTGRPDRYGEIWSALFSALARAGDDRPLWVGGPGRTGQRQILCGVGDQAVVVAPDGGERSLQVDPAAGEQACAAYWPNGIGWHLARDGRGAPTAFYVHSADAAPSLQIAANREATLALAASAPARSQAAAAQRVPGTSWPWLVVLILTLSLCWSLERRRDTRARAGTR